MAIDTTKTKIVLKSSGTKYFFFFVTTISTSWTAFDKPRKKSIPDINKFILSMTGYELDNAVMDITNTLMAK